MRVTRPTLPPVTAVRPGAPDTSAVVASTALLTDHYELTMLEGALRSGAANRRSVFEVFARRLPEGRRYGVVAGTGRLLEALSRFVFEDDELVALERSGVVGPETLRWLAGYRFGGDRSGCGEGGGVGPPRP